MPLNREFRLVKACCDHDSVIPLYKPVKIAIGILLGLGAMGVLTEGRFIAAIVLGAVSVLMLRSAYYHGKDDPPPFA